MGFHRLCVMTGRLYYFIYCTHYYPPHLILLLLICITSSGSKLNLTLLSIKLSSSLANKPCVCPSILHQNPSNALQMNGFQVWSRPLRYSDFTPPWVKTSDVGFTPIENFVGCCIANGACPCPIFEIDSMRYSLCPQKFRHSTVVQHRMNLLHYGMV